MTSARVTTLFTTNCWVALHRYLGTRFWNRLADRCLVHADECYGDRLQAPIEASLDRGVWSFLEQGRLPEERPS